MGPNKPPLGTKVLETWDDSTYYGSPFQKSCATGVLTTPLFFHPLKGGFPPSKNYPTTTTTTTTTTQHNTMPSNPDTATRASIVALKALSGKTTREIALLTGLSISSINRIYARAIERGFDPNVLPLIVRDEHVQDGARSGRPKKLTTEAAEMSLAKVHLDRYGREKTCADIAGELSSEGFPVSATTIWRVLRKAGLRKAKPTRKPGLTQMEKERLEWCQAQADSEAWVDTTDEEGTA